MVVTAYGRNCIINQNKHVRLELVTILAATCKIIKNVLDQYALLTQYK